MMPDPTERNTPQITLCAPSIQRRFIAAQTDDPNTLIALASDESYFVRRQAVQNPNTPAWILDLLVRAGATPDLQGVQRHFGDLDTDQLTHLAELGSWGRFLAARYPASPAAFLTTIAQDPDWRVRSGLLDNPHTPDKLIADLLGQTSASELEATKCLGQLQINAEMLAKLVRSTSPELRLALARHPAATAEILGVLVIVKVVVATTSRHFSREIAHLSWFL